MDIYCEDNHTSVIIVALKFAFKRIEKNIFKESKKKFNIGSPKQLGEILYNELKIAA